MTAPEADRSATLRWLLLVGWFALVGYALWQKAAINDSPPVWDALSYYVKAQQFWAAVARTAPFDPFAVEMTVRPPLTVLVSFPFGLGDWRPYFFRTQFVPVLLLGLAVMALAPLFRDRGARWIVLSAAIAASGLPSVFQLQPSESMPHIMSWGLVDLFMAGLAVLAVTALLRAVATESLAWSLVAILAAVGCFWTKPAGALVIGTVLGGWALLLLWRGWRARSIERRRLAHWLVGVVIGTAGFLVAYWSPYMSAQNLAFGAKVLANMRAMSIGFAPELVAPRLVLAAGWPVLAMLALGALAAAIIARHRALLVAAIVALALGAAFWVNSGDVAQVRYFLPFLLMASVFVLPPFVDAIARWPRAVRAAACLALCLPALASGVVAAMPEPPAAAQRLLGLNLKAGQDGAQVAQARAIIERSVARRLPLTHVYASGTNTAMQALMGVLEFEARTGPSFAGLRVLLPYDWAEGFAFRFVDLAKADFIVYDPGEATGDGSGPVDRFESERTAMLRWFDALGEAEGVVRRPGPRLQVLEVADRAAYAKALAGHAASRPWRPMTLAGYRPEVAER